ncbi:hypothetical protein [Noviherbaspirillum sp.]|uniref:hypothetical protein n=1 Tax=Noviherbaspirillum sp. TaxID=1926288 RepID=UPI002FE3DB3F
MKTIVIQSNKRPASDDALSRLLGLTKEMEDNENSTMWFGIENDSGDVYRVIGVESAEDYVKVLRQLSAAGFWVESLEAETSASLHAVVKAPGAVQSLPI